jgi:hypothetical protein
MARPDPLRRLQSWLAERTPGGCCLIVPLTKRGTQG